MQRKLGSMVSRNLLHTFLFYLLLVWETSAQDHDNLQLDGRWLQSISAVKCTNLKLRYKCTFSAVYAPSNKAATTAVIKVTCPTSSTLKFQFRKATGCSCSASVTYQGQTKYCYCNVCPAGFGRSPIALNCDYPKRSSSVSPYVTDGCKSYDCGATCNGECTTGCFLDSQQCQTKMSCPVVDEPYAPRRPIDYSIPRTEKMPLQSPFSVADHAAPLRSPVSS